MRPRVDLTLADPAQALKQIDQAAATLNPVAFLYLIGPETIAATLEADVFGRLGIPLIVVAVAVLFSAAGVLGSAD